MPGIELTPENFRVSNKVLTLVGSRTSTAITIVLFYSGTDAREYLPIFGEFQKMVPYYTAIVDFKTHRKVFEESKGTTTPIQSVPYIILFNKGVPFAKMRSPPMDPVSLAEVVRQTISKNINQPVTVSSAAAAASAAYNGYGRTHAPPGPGGYIPPYQPPSTGRPWTPTELTQAPMSTGTRGVKDPSLFQQDLVAIDHMIAHNEPWKTGT